VRGLLILLAGLSVSFLLGVVLFNKVIMPRFVQHGASISVPQLTGLTWTEAEERCGRLGLEVQVEDRRYSEGIPSDRVLSQFPEAGSTVKPGRTVRVHLSLGIREVTIPDVRGMTLRQATLQLENANLRVGRVGRIYEENESASAGQTVRAMRPGAGAPATTGGKVDLLVAVGGNPEPLLMPDLVGRALDEVRALVERRGFRVGRVSYRSRPGVYPGTVLEHHPLPGSLILQGETIDLVAATPD